MSSSLSTSFEALIAEASKVVVDKERELRMALTCVLSGGHLLIEDVPGVGKTTLVQTLGHLLGLDTRRIQFTIDLLPADIIGTQVFHPNENKFEFHPGPLFSQLVMTDELNRASPRTQSALLQAMEEGEVSVDGKTWPLPKPFVVIATQNPHQQLGTFPLPESQLDRFLMSLDLDYASKETEVKLFRGEDPRRLLGKLKPLVSVSEIFEFQNQVEKVMVSEVVANYVGQLLRNSRESSDEGLPLSTRAGLSLIKAAKTWALLEGREHLRPEDVQEIFVPVVAHRLGGNHGLKKGKQWAEKLKVQTEVPL